MEKTMEKCVFSALYSGSRLSTISILSFCQRRSSFFVIIRLLMNSSVGYLGVSVTRHRNAQGIRSALEMPHSRPPVMSRRSRGLKM